MENLMDMENIIGKIQLSIKVIKYIIFSIIGNFVDGLRNGKGIWIKSSL